MVLDKIGVLSQDMLFGVDKDKVSFLTQNTKIMSLLADDSIVFIDKVVKEIDYLVLLTQHKAYERDITLTAYQEYDACYRFKIKEIKNKYNGLPCGISDIEIARPTGLLSDGIFVIKNSLLNKLKNISTQTIIRLIKQANKKGNVNIYYYNKDR
jgi:hypothetical protein